MYLFDFIECFTTTFCALTQNEMMWIRYILKCWIMKCVYYYKYFALYWLVTGRPEYLAYKYWEHLAIMTTAGQSHDIGQGAGRGPSSRCTPNSGVSMLTFYIKYIPGFCHNLSYFILIVQSSDQYHTLISNYSVRQLYMSLISQVCDNVSYLASTVSFNICMYDMLVVFSERVQWTKERAKLLIDHFKNLNYPWSSLTIRLTQSPNT